MDDHLADVRRYDPTASDLAAYVRDTIRDYTEHDLLD